MNVAFSNIVFWIISDWAYSDDPDVKAHNVMNSKQFSRQF